jgi:predicted nucleic acid-binding protein
VRLLLDTNVVLDVILARAPWAAEAAALMAAIEAGRADGFVAGHTITTVHYIVAKAAGRQTAATAVSDLLRIVGVVSMESTDFHHALVLGLADYEDAVQAAACLKVGADFLVTRNAKDYKGAPVAPRSAGEVLALLQAGPESAPER